MSLILTPCKENKSLNLANKLEPQKLDHNYNNKETTNTQNIIVSNFHLTHK